ncbi:hypothetical protein LINGRAHAP2_LOCUS17842 [Linum grandiflorum]
MVSEPPMEFIKDDSIAARFDGKNYALWEHQFRVHVQGKALLSYLTGETSIPDPPTTPAAADSTPTMTGAHTKAIEAHTKAILTWQTNNAKVVSWILGSVIPPIALSLRCFTSAADIWKHLKQTYAQVNTSVRPALFLPQSAIGVVFCTFLCVSDRNSSKSEQLLLVTMSLIWSRSLAN